MRVVIALLFLLLGSACSGPGLRTTDLRYYSTQTPVPAEEAVVPVGIDPSDGLCLRVVDTRLRTEAEGWSFPREQIQTWLVDGLSARLGMAIEYSDQAPDAGGYVALERLYLRHIATSMAGVAVLRAHGTEASRTVRGNRTRLNWNGTSTEISRVLSQALDNAITKLPLPAVVNRNCTPLSGD